MDLRRYMATAATVLMLLGAVGAAAQGGTGDGVGDFCFNHGVRYSQWVAQARTGSFYANKTASGFAVFDTNGNRLTNGNARLDYVPGLVAKAVVENVQYYSQYQWAQAWTTPFFYSMADYCNSSFTMFPQVGGSLDNLNAAKMLFGLYELTQAGGAYANTAVAAKTKSNVQNALNNAKAAFRDHNSRYRIGKGTSACEAGHAIVEGGWWHKSQYRDEMWLDGAYMGPALFAQLRNYSGSDIIGDDWTIAFRQIEALWEMCWNSDAGLLYHAFSAEGHNMYSNTWAGYDSGKGVYHSASYWGRAEGWFLLALVDILEQMDKAGLGSTDNYMTLRSHLADVCAGLAKWQDGETGCWYQLLDEDGTFSASRYGGMTYPARYNYLESSASALFAAGIMKAVRLGYIAEADYGAVARRAYAGLVNNFFAADGEGGIHLFGSCRSAGLGSMSNRDGSKAYYLLGSDVMVVAKDEMQTEGKVLGAFILAATEYERLYQDNTVLLEKDLAPRYDIKKGETIECTASGSAADIAYQWYRNGEAVEGEQGSSIAPRQPGNYYCTATAGSRSVRTSVATVTLDGETGVEPVRNYESGNNNYNYNYIYNPAGQRVGKGYRGMKIMKGCRVKG